VDYNLIHFFGSYVICLARKLFITGYRAATLEYNAIILMQKMQSSSDHDRITMKDQAHIKQFIRKRLEQCYFIRNVSFLAVSL